MLDSKQRRQIKYISDSRLLCPRETEVVKKKNRVFSIELNSRKYLKNIILSNGTDERVTLEGTLGELVEARFEEGVLLQVVGSEGILRVDLCEGEIKEVDL